jgi:phytoene desaturase
VIVMKPDFGRDPVVIVGAGVAGLSAAHLLARQGFAVRVFEARPAVGGCCTTTTRDGYQFNDGAVYLAILGILDRAFAEIGLARPELLPLRKISALMSAILPDGSRVTLRDRAELTVTGRTVDGTRLQAELQQLIVRWQPVLRFVSDELTAQPFSPWRLARKGWRHLPRFRGTAAAELTRLFSDRAVVSALAGALLYNGVPAAQMPAPAILGLVAAVTEGFYLPEGGMGRVPEVLGSELERRGVAVSLNSTVESIVIADRRIRGVDVEGLGRVEAAAVLSTTSAMRTLGSLMPREQVPPALARRLERAPLSHRAVSIQLGLSNRIDAPAHSVSVLPWMEDQHELFAQDGQRVEFPTYLVPTLTMPELASRGGSIIELFYPVRADIPLAYWDADRKARLLEAAIATLRRLHDLDIVVAQVRSPGDFRETMHLYEGALYGLSPSATPREQFPHDSGIPGLFLAGQTTFPGYGVGAAMMSGLFAAKALAATA